MINREVDINPPIMCRLYLRSKQSLPRSTVAGRCFVEPLASSGFH